jgi:peroxiredoxin Q/BCP
MKIFLVLGFLVAAGAVYLWAKNANASPAPEPGQVAPDFNLPDQNNVMHKLDEFKGKWLVLYFYPKDDTPGCTEEACTFRDDIAALSKMGAQIIGVSIDSVASHEQFAKKYQLQFPLLSDQKGEVAERYGSVTDLGVMKIARRYTFLIDPQGKVAKVYKKVETSKHSKEIIDDLKALGAKP